MARRIARVGRVTVSLRRSTTLATPKGGCNSLSGSVVDCAGIFFSAVKMMQSANALIRRKLRSRCSGVSVLGGRQVHRVREGLKIRAAENDRISKRHRIFADGPDRFPRAGGGRGRVLLPGPAARKLSLLARWEFCPMRRTARR